MTKSYSFPCGCSFPLKEDKTISFNIENVPENCPAVFDMLTKGLTLGVFQFETPTGKTWCQKLKPRNIEDLCALASILRPGTLNARDSNGISLTEHYCKRKNGEEEPTPIHPLLNKILEKRYGVIVYQEDSINIVKELGDFTVSEAEKLRKCVTKTTMFVSKQRGWISIKELLDTGYKNDDFLVMDENGKQCWKKIKDIWHTGQQTVSEVTSWSGLNVKATQYHQFLTTDGWKAKLRLKLNEDFLIRASYVEYDGIDKYSSDLMFVIAGMLTEGYFVDYCHSHFTNFDKEMMDWFSDAFFKVFNESPSYDSLHRVARLRNKHKKFLNKYMAFGKSGKKFIPKEMMQATKETTRRFLSFMLAAEGGVCKNGHFEYSSKSLRMIRQVQLLLLRFGINSWISKSKIEKYGIYYKLYINNRDDQLKIWYHLTDYWPKQKKQNLSEIIANKDKLNYSSNKVPGTIVKQMMNQYPWIGNGESGRLHNGSPLTRRGFSRLAKLTKDKHWINLSKGKQFYDKLVSFGKKQKEIDVYDFSIEDENTPYIIANGLVIHNSIGKKDSVLISEMHNLFIEKIKQSRKIPIEEAEQVFALIKAGERYSFCRAHSWRYGAVLAYQTAYIKCHFPLHFYASKLKNIKLKKSQKKEEDENGVADFVNDAKLFNIETQLPDLRDLEPEFYTRNKIIKVGITNIKGIGDSIFNKIINAIQGAEAAWQKPLKDFSYYEFLTGCIIPYLGESVSEKLIKAGSLDWLGLSRMEMLYQLSMVRDLTNDEVERLLTRIRDFKHLDELLSSCADMTKNGGICSRNKKVILLKDKVRLLKNPEISLVDQSLQKSWDEENLLGIAISSCEIDSCDVTMCNSNCKEIVAGRDDEVILPGQIVRMSTRIISKGKNQGKEMATLFINDGTCELECLVFAEAYEKYKNTLFNKGCFVFRGQRNKKGSNFIVRDVWLAKSN